MNSWLDMLPGSERQKVREKYKMSAAAYEKLRQKVKGPEDLEREMHRNEMLAQLKFDLETQPKVQEALKKQFEKDLEQGGLEAVLQNPDIPAELKKQLEQGSFDITVASPSESVPDQLVIAPEGNVSENIPVNKSLSDSYLSQLQVDK